MSEEVQVRTPEEIAAVIARSEAEARKFIAEAQKAEADARKATAEAIQEEVAQRTTQRAEEAILAANHFHHVYHFTAGVDPGSVAKCMAEINIWRRTEREPVPFEIIFTSPGGSVTDGLALFDFIQQCRRAGHKVTTGTLGMAASMAGILLQAGDVRWCGKEAWVLIHQVQAGMMGSWGDLQDRMGWLERIQQRILDIFAERAKEAGQAGTASHPFTRKTLEKEWTRKDWWLSSDDCLKGGIVDEIR